MQVDGYKVIKEPVRIVIHNSALWDAIEKTARKELLEIEFDSYAYSEFLEAIRTVRDAFYKHCDKE